jgi:hypothetical protein
MRASLFALLALALAACGRPVVGTPARGFVELKDDPSYDFRAVAPEGVAVAARVVKMETRNDVAFWEHAVTLRMREMDGYALMEAKDAQGPGGVPGRELVFGHDEEGKPFVYRVRVFVIGDKLLVEEAGGSREQMERAKQSVEWMLGQLRLR